MTSGQRRARVVVADDQDLTRLGMVAVLASEPDLCVVDQAATAAEVLKAVDMHRPDLVLLDAHMSDAAGPDAVRQIRAQSPGTQVVMVTSWDAPVTLLEAIQVGASGYISKDTRQSEIIRQVRRALRGELLQGSLAAQPLLREARKHVPLDAYVMINRLTPRQRQVLALIADGLSSPDIARRLDIRPSTVRKLTEQLFQRIGVSNRTRAAMYWVVASDKSPDNDPVVGF